MAFKRGSPQRDRLRQVHSRSKAGKASIIRAPSLNGQFTRLSVKELKALNPTPQEKSEFTPRSVEPPARTPLIENLLEKQANASATPTYLRKVQKEEIKEYMRADAVEWMLKLNMHMEYHAETFEVAVILFDRFLSTMRIKPAHVQLIGATCMLVAAKMNEAWNKSPTLKELSMACNNCFSCMDFERMERVMLNKLSWDVNPVSSCVLLHQAVPLLPLTPDLAKVAVSEGEKFITAAKLEYRFLCYDAATLAAAATLCGLATVVGLAERAVLDALLTTLRCDEPTAAACYDNMRQLRVDVLAM